MKNVVSSIVLTMLVIGAHAESITHGGTTVNIDFVNIGYAGNDAQNAANRAHGESGGDGYGAVAYDYRIGQTEVTIDQFTVVRAADNRIGDGDEGYWNSGDGISTPQVGSGAPASYVSWNEAAKFCNWLTTGDAYTGAYQFDGSGAFISINRDAAITAFGIAYMMPTLDEWYKAAYFKPDGSGYSLYANGSDDVADLTHGTANGWNYDYVNPSPNFMWETGFGGEEQNGTYDVMGNAWEWIENEFPGPIGTARELKGGRYDYSEYGLRSSLQYGGGGNNLISPSDEYASYGFRVAAIPEPSTVSLLGLGAVAGVLLRRRRVTHIKSPPLRVTCRERW